MESIVGMSMCARLLPLVFSLVALSCGTRSQMLNMWVDPDYPPAPLQKLLVVALWESEPEREAWESAFARALEKNDVVAVPSHHVLSSAIPDSATIFDAARRAGFDGVVAIYETYEQTKTVYVSEYVERVYIFPSPYEIYPFPRTVKVVDTYHPPHEKTETALRCDVEVWTAPDDVRMVWTGTTEVLEPDKNVDTCSIVAGWVGYQLVFCGLVPAGF